MTSWMSALVGGGGGPELMLREIAAPRRRRRSRLSRPHGRRLAPGGELGVEDAAGLGRFECVGEDTSFPFGAGVSSQVTERWPSSAQTRRRISPRRTPLSALAAKACG